MRSPRIEFAVGAFLLLALASLLVLALASTNRQWGFGNDSYELKARFTSIGALRPNAPIKIAGVAVGKVADIQVDPVKYDSVVILAIDNKFKDLPADTSAGILTNGLLGESYISLSPGGDPETLKPGDEVTFTQPAVDLIQMVGKYMFSGGGKPAGDADAASETETSTEPSAPTDESK
ncbi:MAG TPA: outer membrane lipid asymmetry maintenance protein MlaD [Lysobacter sp.]